MTAEVVPINGAEPEPSRRQERLSRRRLHFITKIGQAQTPREKLDASIDYFRAMTADHRVNPEKAAIATEHLAERLRTSADHLAATIRRQR